MSRIYIYMWLYTYICKYIYIYVLVCVCIHTDVQTHKLDTAMRYKRIIAHIWIISQIWPSYVTHVNWVMSHLWMYHVTYVWFLDTPPSPTLLSLQLVRFLAFSPTLSFALPFPCLQWPPITLIANLCLLYVCVCVCLCVYVCHGVCVCICVYVCVCVSVCVWLAINRSFCQKLSFTGVCACVFVCVCVCVCVLLAINHSVCWSLHTRCVVSHDHVNHVTPQTTSSTNRSGADQALLILWGHRNGVLSRF